MCFVAPKPVIPKTEAPPPPPPPPPPAPERTATDLRIGDDRQSVGPKNFLKRSLGTQPRNSLVIPFVGINSQGSNGLNIPTS